jgi:riboflavin kinase / FMN adenylyltransferase
MKIVRDLYAEFEIDGPVVFSLGVFDGIHRGHRHLIQSAQQLKGQGRLVLLSFTHAPKFSVSDLGGKRICTLAHKERLLSELEIDLLVHIPFTEELKKLSAQKFLEHLNAKMTISHYVVCHDVSFGCNRAGNLEYLKKEALVRNQKVYCCEKIQDVSSTSVRYAIQQGAFDLVCSMLGGPYSIFGSCTRIPQGFQLLEDCALCLPPPGTYDVMVVAAGTQDSTYVPMQATICDNQLRLPSHLMHTHEGECEIFFSGLQHVR